MGLILSGFKPDLVGEAIDLGSGVGIPLLDIINLISEFIDSPLKPFIGAIPDRLYESPQIANTKETYRLLGFRPHWDVKDGIKSTIEWYRQHPEFYRTEKQRI